MATELQDVVDAVQDLTRVVLATQGKFDSRADMVRRLTELSIPPTRIAAILAMPQKHVHSVLTKARKKQTINDSQAGEVQDGEAA